MHPNCASRFAPDKILLEPFLYNIYCDSIEDELIWLDVATSAYNPRFLPRCTSTLKPTKITKTWKSGHNEGFLDDRSFDI